MSMRVMCLWAALAISILIPSHGLQIPGWDSIGVLKSPAQQTPPKTPLSDAETNASSNLQKRSTSEIPNTSRDGESPYAADREDNNVRGSSTAAPPGLGRDQATTSTYPGPDQIRAIYQLTQASLRPGGATTGSDRHGSNIDGDLDLVEIDSSGKHYDNRGGRYSDSKNDYRQLYESNIRGQSGEKSWSAGSLHQDVNSPPTSLHGTGPSGISRRRLSSLHGTAPSGISRRRLWRDWRHPYYSDWRDIYSARGEFGEQMSASSGGGYGGGVSYGYGGSPSCECTQYDVLGLLTGGAALAALGAFVLQQLTANTTGRALDNEWSLQFPSFLQSAISLDGSEEFYPVPSFRSLLLESWSRLAHGEGIIWDGSDPRSAFGRVLQQVPEGFLQRSLSELAARVTPRAMAGVAVRAVCVASGYRGQPDLDVGQPSRARREEIAVSARDGYGSSGGSCDCFAGIVGALAGFAALGALVAFAINAATTTTTVAPGRALPPMDGGGGIVDPLTADFTQRMLQLLTEEQSCLPHRLCTLSRDASLAGDPYTTLVQLASLPLSWLLSQTTGGEMPDYCTGLMTSQVQGQCHRAPHSCGS